MRPSTHSCAPLKKKSSHCPSYHRCLERAREHAGASRKIYGTRLPLNWPACPTTSLVCGRGGVLLLLDALVTGFRIAVQNGRQRSPSSWSVNKASMLVMTLLRVSHPSTVMALRLLDGTQCVDPRIGFEKAVERIVLPVAMI